MSPFCLMTLVVKILSAITIVYVLIAYEREQFDQDPMILINRDASISGCLSITETCDHDCWDVAGKLWKTV